MDYKEKIKGLVGDDAKADEIISSIKEAFIDKEQYNRKIKDLEKAAAERDALQGEIEKNRLASMSEVEKLEHALKQTENAKLEYAKKLNRLDAEKLFLSKGISQETYGTIIDNFIYEDAETTQKVVTGVIETIVKERESAVAKTKEDMLGTTPQPGATPPASAQQTKKIRVI